MIDLKGRVAHIHELLDQEGTTVSWDTVDQAKAKELVGALMDYFVHVENVCRVADELRIASAAFLAHCDHGPNSQKFIDRADELRGAIAALDAIATWRPTTSTKVSPPTGMIEGDELWLCDENGVRTIKLK